METPPLLRLPLEMMMSLGSWTNLPSGWANASAGWPFWSQNQAKKLQKAVENEAKSRADSFFSGFTRYLKTPYTRDLAEPPAIWKRGNARLLDYGARAKKQPITLFIPSLINRYYILDLDKNRSLLRWLAAHGAHPVALDWGKPGEYEKDFGCEEYITDIILPAIEFLYKSTGKPVTLAGYCMGGVLSVAAAQLKPKQVAKLALFATPWDFHCREFKPFVVDELWQKQITTWIDKNDTVSADVIQSLFYMTDPFVFEQKFRRFADMKPFSDAAQEFIALERWVNDGVPMTSQLAKDCLIGWAQKNILAGGTWKIAGQKIDPRKIKQPTFIAIPEHDYIVPEGCALPLADAIPYADIVRPGAGHVSMIVGSGAKKELWAPLLKWLTA